MQYSLSVLLITRRPLGYESVYLSLHKVEDTPFHIQGEEELPSIDPDASLPANNVSATCFLKEVHRQVILCSLPVALP